MKVLVAILLLSIIVFGSGTSYAPCRDCADTIPRIFETIIAQRIDSAARATKPQLDSLNEVKDSLVVELKEVIKERKKKLQLGDDTGWAVDSFRMPNGKTQYWSWYFYRYPDGSYRFSHKKIRIK